MNMAPTMLMTASAMTTRANTAAISLVRSDVRLEIRRTTSQGRAAQWPVRPLAPSAVMPDQYLRRRQPQHVPDAAQGMDQPRFLGVDLAPQHGHVRLHDARIAAEVVVPHVIEDLHLGQHPVG